jgi:alpha-galactosidase
VEVPGILTSEGPNGLNVGCLPEAIAELCRRQISINELTVEAFRKGDRRLVHQLFALDPMIQDPAVAVKLAGEYLELYEGYLPTFT